MFTRATKTQSHLRLALYGPSGSGKTYTALVIGAALGKPVALIDTERGSASKYAGDVADFDVVQLTSFEPEKYIEAMREAVRGKYRTLIIDSLSHAWMGRGGLLDQADAKGGRFDAWKTLTPKQHSLIDAILAYPGDVIVTMRTKTEYVVEKDERGKSAPRKVGLAPVQKDGVEYEFDIAASMDVENTMHVEKSRCPALSGAVIRKPGADVAATLRAWLAGGQPAASKPAQVQPPPNEVFNLIASHISKGALDIVEEAINTAKAECSITEQQCDALRTAYNNKRKALRASASKPNEAA